VPPLAPAAGPVLRLVEEAKLADLLGPGVGGRLEASGVLARPGSYLVIFDDNADVAVIDARLRPGPGNRLVASGRPAADQVLGGFEDIAHDPVADRYYLLVEAATRRSGELMASVDELDGELHRLTGQWLRFPLAGLNKGLEGLTCVRRGDRVYLLGLCEGNHCADGARGRRPGGGRVQLFTAGEHRWDHAGTIALPPGLAFADYSSIAVQGERIAVLSQEASALWVGEFRPGTWELAGPGRTWRFPSDPGGEVAYCNVEGVSWIGPDRVVVVSDRAKAGAAERCRAKDRSIHVFQIP
jgi:hypothetical protein